MTTLGVDEPRGRLGSCNDDGLAAEDVRPEDAAVRGEPILDEAKGVLRKGERLTKERHAVASWWQSVAGGN